MNTLKNIINWFKESHDLHPMEFFFFFCLLFLAKYKDKYVMTFTAIHGIREQLSTS